MVRRVVVTGLGVISPLGLNVTEMWDALCQGKSGIAFHEDYPEDLRVKISGRIHGFSELAKTFPKDLKRMDDFIQYGAIAADQAIAQAGFDESLDLKKVGVALGSGIGGLSMIEANHSAVIRAGTRRISPFFIPGTIINLLPGMVSIKYGYRGPNYSVVTACTTGAHNIGMAYRMIQHGDADVMITGGAEKASTILGMGGFASMRALSQKNETPEQASRPFDEDRDGFVLSDGAAVLVLESYEHAVARGANILAEMTGYAMNSDGSHMTQPSLEGMQDVMKMALLDAKCESDEIDYINPHATSTPVGDQIEGAAIQSVFKNPPPISATKSMLGHMIGATGATEAMICVLSLMHQKIVPTINCQNPIIDLPIVRDHAVDHKMERVLSNSFGFGGTNASLIFQRYIR